MRKLFLLSLVGLIVAFIYRHQNQEKALSLSTQKSKQTHSKFLNLSQSSNKNEKINTNRSRKTIYKKREATLSPAPKKTNNIKTMTPVKSQDMAYQFDNGDVVVEFVEIDGDLLIAQGDLIVGDFSKLDKYQDGTEPLLLPMPKKWPNGKIPYKIEIPTFAESSIDGIDGLRERVIDAIQSINDLTNVKFLPKKDSDKDYVEIQFKRERCISNIGYLGGKQLIGLGVGCNYHKIIHELMHTLGFFHEQNRIESRDFVQVLWENIEETNWIQFKIIPRQLINDLEIPFSYETVMLYPSKAFSKFEGDFSMVKSDGSEIDINSFPNQSDIDRINKLYPKDKK